MSKKHVLVVGAGMSGLMAARTLEQAGHTVTVVDKGRGVGGRMATRRVQQAVFDHGAQFFTVRHPRFATIVEGLVGSGAASVWTHAFQHGDGLGSGQQQAQPSGDAAATPAPHHTYPRYRGTAGMSSVPKQLSQGLLDVRLSTQVAHINTAPSGQWVVTIITLGATGAATTGGAPAEGGGRTSPRGGKSPRGEHSTIFADALVMTPPAEQTLALMQKGNAPLPPTVVAALSAIQFHPCFAVLATLDRPSGLTAPGGVFASTDTIGWIADNALKGISPTPCVTIHATPAFTHAHYHTPQDEVGRLLIEAARAHGFLAKDAAVLDMSVQRWKYSQPSVLHPEPTLVSSMPGLVAFAGDAFGVGARVEGAAVSGQAAAEALLPLLL